MAVAINSCRRPQHDVQVVYPGIPGHYLLVLQSRGAFRLRSPLHDLVVDAATCVIGRAGESAEVSHPFGTGDRATYVALSPSLFADVSANHLTVPASAPVTGPIARLHYQLVVSILRGHDVLLVQETGVASVRSGSGCGWLAIAWADPERLHAAANRRRGVRSASG
jgi:hypothetical protein